MTDEEPVVWVRRQWNDWRSAKVRLADLEGVHWTNVSGGVFAPAPRDFMHGYISCDAIMEGEVAHSCSHGDGPHRIKVCVVQKGNSKNVIDLLKTRAGPRPQRIG